jgi:hypothetical protein
MKKERAKSRRYQRSTLTKKNIMPTNLKVKISRKSQLKLRLKFRLRQLLRRKKRRFLYKKKQRPRLKRLQKKKRSTFQLLAS